MESEMFQRDHNPNKEQKAPTRMDLQHSETCRQVVCQLIIIVYTESYDIFDISVCIWMFHINLISKREMRMSIFKMVA